MRHLEKTVNPGKYFTICLMLAALFISACSDEEEDLAQEQDQYETALYLAYAAGTDGEVMHGIVMDDAELAISRFRTIVYRYYQTYGSLPSTEVSLSDLSAISAYIPSGLTGTIQGSGTTISAAFTFTDCALGALMSYTGTINLTGTYNTSDATFTICDASIPSLTITLSSSSYTTLSYSNFTLSVDNGDAYPDYTASGALSVDGSTYEFSNLAYTQSSSSTISLSGYYSVAGLVYGISGSVSSDWTSGSITISGADSSVSITLDDTLATFTLNDGSSWDVTDWAATLLVP